MTYKAEFEIGPVFFYIEMHGSYNYCFVAAGDLAKKIGVTFTGILEEVK